MKVFTLYAVVAIFFFLQVTISYGRENIDLPVYEGEMESTLQTIHEDVREDEADPFEYKHDNKNHHDISNNGEKEQSNDEEDESYRKKGNRENNSKKRSHPQVCPPGWLSPWDCAGNSNCGGCGGCGCGCGCGNCGCNGGFGGVGAGDELDSAECGCGDYHGCGGGCCCGCGGFGCRFHGGFMHHNGFGRRLPRQFNDGRVQHVWLSKFKNGCSF